MADHDVIVIGGGIAGLTAALFAARLGRSTLVLEAAMPGGQLISVSKIEDFPGFLNGVSGFELAPNTQMQAMQAGAEFGMEEAQRLTLLDEAWLVGTTGGEHWAKAVVIATGSRPRALGVPGEARLQDRGISHCASCSGPLHRGDVVGVVGGGDWAISEALTLAEHAEQVLVFHRHDELAAQQAYLKRAQENPKIVFHPDTEVEEVVGDDAVDGVRVRNAKSGEAAEIALSALFVYIGSEPNTAFLKGVTPLDANGRVPTDLCMRTERRGLLAAGDVRRDSAAQAVTAAGDGATAAIAAHRFLDDGTWPHESASAMLVPLGEGQQ